MSSDVSSWNLKKKNVCVSHEVMIPNIILEDYSAVKTGAKYSLYLIHFDYSILKLKLHYQEKNSIKFDDYAAV